MTVFTSAGTTLALTAAVPAALSRIEYEALTYTVVGEVSDLGDIPSRVYEIVPWRNITNRGERKVKGGYSLPPQTITIGCDPADAGQALLDAAVLSDAAYTIRIAHPQLGSLYGRALIMGGATSFGDVNTVVTRQVTLEYQSVLGPQDNLPPLWFSLDGSPDMAWTLSIDPTNVVSLGD